jgi:hypothetical protein
MLLSIGRIPLFSTGDAKVCDSLPIPNYLVIVTTREYAKLPTRFLAHFAVIQLAPISKFALNVVAE